jgi:hypothetical protein
MGLAFPEDVSLIAELKRLIRESGGGRKLVLGTDKYNELLTTLANEDIWDVQMGGKGPVQSITAVYGVPLEIDHKDRGRVELIP